MNFYQYRAEERFPFCSTSKVIVVSAILKESEQNGNLLQKQITYGKEDVEKSGYAPITQQHLSNGITTTRTATNMAKKWRCCINQDSSLRA